MIGSTQINTHTFFICIYLFFQCPCYNSSLSSQHSCVLWRRPHHMVHKRTGKVGGWNLCVWSQCLSKYGKCKVNHLNEVAPALYFSLNPTHCTKTGLKSSCVELGLVMWPAGLKAFHSDANRFKKKKSPNTELFFSCFCLFLSLFW